ncbi:hypothetical protein JOQ06_023894 [Pogonophryne albipinna]|uniref:Uncharacterized protein n=1 Tax=Pogonophryne albipinna TaxID=1090488 RepID=A0AAD6BK32_9TELE|nr:hypothetical protein JOQ06_023894 [Pogonophryne albipinna]
MSSCSNAAVNTVDYSPHALIMTIDFALAVNARSASLGHCSTLKLRYNFKYMVRDEIQCGMQFPDPALIIGKRISHR